jgi:hypothetical protein
VFSRQDFLPLRRGDAEKIKTKNYGHRLRPINAGVGKLNFLSVLIGLHLWQFFFSATLRLCGSNPFGSGESRSEEYRGTGVCGDSTEQP